MVIIIVRLKLLIIGDVYISVLQNDVSKRNAD